MLQEGQPQGSTVACQLLRRPPGSVTAFWKALKAATVKTHEKSLIICNSYYIRAQLTHLGVLYHPYIQYSTNIILPTICRESRVKGVVTRLASDPRYQNSCKYNAER